MAKVEEFSVALDMALGFSDAYPELARTADMGLFEQLITKLPPKSFALVGGAAVVLHVGKQARTISPDIDVLVMADGLKVAAKEFKFQPNTLGITINNGGGIEIDLLLAAKRWQRAAVANAKPHRFGTHNVPVITPDYLVVSKLLSGRDKDSDDLLLLLRHVPEAYNGARRLLKQFAPDQVDDLRSMHTWAQLAPKP